MAVTVRNDGGAVADVPVTIRAGINSVEQRMRLPAQTTVTQRILVTAAPSAVTVNDGSTPEVQTSTHTYPIDLATPKNTIDSVIR